MRTDPEIVATTTSCLTRSSGRLKREGFPICNINRKCLM